MYNTKFMYKNNVFTNIKIKNESKKKKAEV